MKKRLLSLIVCFSLILPVALMLTACGKAKPKSMSVSDVQTQFLYQDEFVFGEDAEVVIKMSKGDNLEFDADDLKYNAEKKTAETDDYKVDYSAFNSNVLGEYKIKVTYKKEKNISYTYKVTVSERPFVDSDITAEDYSGVYDGEPHSISLACTVDGATITYSTDGETYVETKPTFTDAGEYVVYFIVDKENYAPPVSGTKNVVIEKKEVTLVWGSTSFVYNKADQIPTCTLSGIVEGDTCTVTVTGGETDAGNHTATATSVSNNNYKLPEEKTKAFVISPKPVNKPVLATSTEFIYNTAEQGISFEDDFEEGVGAIGVNAATNAGRYTYSVKLASANYVWSDNTTTAVDIVWEIKKKSVAIPVVVGEFVYSQVTKTAVITGFNAALMTKEGKESNIGAGTFNIDFNLIDTLNYYWEGDDISVIAGKKTRTWTIAKATVNADNMRWNYTAPFNYDGTAKTVELENIPSGFVPIYDGNTKTNAGNNYLATVTFNYDSANYNPVIMSPLYWSIAKVNPTYVTPTGIEATKDGELTLADVSLAGYEGFEWLVPTTAVNESGYFTAKYTPADTINYNVLENVQIYINVIDLSKGRFTSYNYYGSNVDLEKDLAIVVTSGTWSHDAQFGVEVNTDSSYTNGNHTDATITYNGQSECVITVPGTYVIEIKVSKEGYNDFIDYKTVEVQKASLMAWNTPSSGSSEEITIDDTLSIVDIYGGQVAHTHTEGECVVDGTWAWKEPNTQLVLGDNNYVAVFTPTESEYYEALEVQISVYASQGKPIRIFNIGQETYTLSKTDSYVEIDVYVPYGDSVIVDFSNIKDGFNIYDMNDELLQGTSFEITSADVTYTSYVRFSFGESNDSIDQNIIINLVDNYYLDAFKVQYKNDSEALRELDLLKFNNGIVQGEVAYILVTAEEGYTATTYVNDVLVGSVITDVELVLGTNKVLVVVKDSEGKAVRYIQKSFEYTLPESYNLPEPDGNETETIATVVGNGSNEMIVVNTIETPTITISATLDTDIYTVTAYKMNISNGSYASVSLNEPIQLAEGANVFKVVLTIANSAKVVKEIVIYDASAGLGASYDATFKNQPIEEYYSIEYQFGSSSSTTNLSNIETIDTYTAFNALNDISVTNTRDETVMGTISNLINNYYLISVISDTQDVLYKIIKIEKWYIEDNQTSAKVFLVVNNTEITEIEDYEALTQMQIMSDCIYIQTINPAASISVNNSALVVDEMVVIALVAFDAQDIDITVTASDGSNASDITLNLQANAVKVFGITPIKNVEGEEEKGTELVANMTAMMMFTGDISINISYDESSYTTASALDLVSNYTFYNAEGEVWTEGDGDKYIKIDMYAPNCEIARGFDFDRLEPIDMLASTEGALFKVVEDNGKYVATIYINADSFGFIIATLTLVDEFIETQVTLSVKDAQNAEAQEFELNLKAVDGANVISDYFNQMNGIECSVGSFVGDTTEYYVNYLEGQYLVYSYTDGVVGTDVLAILQNNDSYVLVEKAPGALEGIEEGTEFVFQTEDVLALTYLLEPNAELQEIIDGLTDGTLKLTVEVTEGVTALNMTNMDVKPVYTEITGAINTFDNMGMQCFGLKLVYNEGEANEFEFVIQCIFASLEDIMGSM